MTSTSNITVLIADAQHLFRDGLKLLLQQERGLELIGEVDDKFAMYEALRQYHPDVVIIDYNLPEYFGYEDVQDIYKYSPNSHVLVISSDDDQQIIYQVLEYGVKGYLTKECGKDEVIKAVYAAASGQKFFCSKVLDVLLKKSFTQKRYASKDTPLSERERQIARCIAEGKSNTLIADEFSISVHTVRTHRKNIMRKLEINSVSELVLYAVQVGMVELKS